VTTIHTTAFAHSAFLYDDREELLERALPYLRQGAESGQSLLVAMPRAQVEAIRGELNGEGADACFMELEDLGRNPARLTSAYRDLADRAEDGICGISEALWAGRSEAEIEECERHEMVLSRAFEALPTCSLLCVYDRSELDDGVVSRVGRTHPELIEDSSPARRSASYEALSDPFAGTLPRPPAEAETIEFDEARLGQEREFLRAAAERACLSSERTADLVLAGNELATNSVEHGGGSGTMRVWRQGELLICEVTDRGRIESALVGRVRPPIEQPRGRGIWLANQVSDLLQIRSGAAGTTLRLAISCAA
jgi:anti-sigma regulatory factor (Ser/Thr protein kinase)